MGMDIWDEFWVCLANIPAKSPEFSSLAPLALAIYLISASGAPFQWNWNVREVVQFAKSEFSPTWKSVWDQGQCFGFWNGYFEIYIFIWINLWIFAKNVFIWIKIDMDYHKNQICCCRYISISPPPPLILLKTKIIWFLEFHTNWQFESF